MGNQVRTSAFTPGRHFVRPIPFKAHRVEGFSPETLEQHYEEVYGGAIRRMNELELELAAFGPDMVMRNDFAKLKSEEIALANEIVLHETYFDSVGEDGGEALTDEDLRAALLTDLSGLDGFMFEFRKTLSCWDREAGWIVLAWHEMLGRLDIFPIETGQGLTAASPLLALDLSDDAFRTDFGFDREAYVGTFLGNIHWGRVADRFRRARRLPLAASIDEEDIGQISVEELKAHIDAGDNVPLVLDVRHDDDRKRYTFRIMTTDWRDSLNVDQWAEEFPRDKPVVVYCMYGFWVSQKVAEELRARGIDARSLEGGIAAWRAMSLPSTDIPSQ